MIGRRDLFAGGAGIALAGAAHAAASAFARPAATATARDFGAIGDGVADDSDALERVFRAMMDGRNAQVITIPPGRYRVTKPIRVRTDGRGPGNITHISGILAHGVRLESEIVGDEPVIELESRATVRNIIIEGLEIRGSGRDGHGLYINCQTRGAYFYNFCLRDIVITGCGGDGLRMVGNVFEGQIYNSYLRDNKRNGATFSHGKEDTVLSAVHVFGAIFGGNGRCGVEMTDGAVDVGFNGCYFLLNRKHGLSASTGCTLLSHCGFENNHMGAEDFEHGDAGIRLLVEGTLIGCTAYSIYNQTHLIRAHVVNRLTLIGCTSSGGARARKAGLGRIGGATNSSATIIGCRGSVQREGAVGIVRMGERERGLRVGARWNDNNLAWLGDYCLWVDRNGLLRMKRGTPDNDNDGQPVGT